MKGTNMRETLPQRATQLKEYEPTMVGMAQDLLTLFLDHEQACKLLDLLGVSVFTYVLDTNVIVKDLSRYLQSEQLTGLMIAAKFGGVRLFASTTVRDEVPKRLERLTSRRGIAIDHARARWWRDYAPLITFLDPADMPALSPRAELVAAVDPDDVATGKIIDLIRPQSALSEDRHLAAYVPSGPDWTKFAVAVRDTAGRDANYVVIYVGGGLTLWIGASAVAGLVSLLLKADRRFLLGVGLVLTVIAGLLVAHPASRGWLREKAEQVLTLGPERLHAYMTFISDALIHLYEQDVQAKLASSFILERQVAHAAPRLVREYIPAILSHSHIPLTADEIAQQMIRQGYAPRGAHPERYVANVLRAHPALFEQQRPSRWGLRSHQTMHVQYEIKHDAGQN